MTMNQQDTEFVEVLTEKQEYLDYIDADMQAFYQIKIDSVSPEL